MTRILLFFLFIFHISFLFSADTYYIYLGGDGSNPKSGNKEEALTFVNDAINLLSDGDNIFIFGTPDPIHQFYYKNITIEKNNITVIGENQNNTVLELSFDFGQYLFTINNCSNVKIKNLHFRSSPFALIISNADSIYIENCLFSNNNYSSIKIINSENIYISNCEINTTSDYGIEILSSDSVFIFNNKIQTNKTGVFLQQARYNLILNNLIILNDVGIEVLDNSNNNFILFNDIKKNLTYGILLENSENNYINANNISFNNDRGIFSPLAQNNFFSYNNIFNNSNDDSININNNFFSNLNTFKLPIVNDTKYSNTFQETGYIFFNIDIDFDNNNDSGKITYITGYYGSQNPFIFPENSLPTVSNLRILNGLIVKSKFYTSDNYLKIIYSYSDLENDTMTDINIQLSHSADFSNLTKDYYQFNYDTIYISVNDLSLDTYYLRVRVNDGKYQAINNSYSNFLVYDLPIIISTNVPPLIADTISQLQNQFDEDFGIVEISLKNYEFDYDDNDTNLIWSIINVAPQIINASIENNDILKLSSISDSYGEAIIILKLYDSKNAFDTYSYKIKILSIPDTPLFVNNIDTIILNEDFGETIINLNKFVITPDTQQLYYQVLSIEPIYSLNYTITDSNLILSSKQDFFGLVNLEIKVFNEYNYFDTTIFRIKITNINDTPQPQIITDYKVLIKQKEYYFIGSVYDADSDILFYNWSVFPETGVSYNNTNETQLIIIPQINGLYTISFSATDNNSTGNYNINFIVIETGVILTSAETKEIYLMDTTIYSFYLSSETINIKVINQDSSFYLFNFDFNLDSGLITIARFDSSLISTNDILLADTLYFLNFGISLNLFDIYLNDISKNEEKYNQLNLTYKYNENDEIIKKYSSYQLSFFWYNENNAKWEKINSEVNTNEYMLKCSIMHFSNYCIFPSLAYNVLQMNLNKVEIYPNPFIPNDGKNETGRNYDGSAGSGIYINGLTPNCKIKIYDITGRLVRELYNNNSGAVIWDAKDKNNCELASGIYFAVIENGFERVVKKFVIIR
ncbi:MAG TPA: right-handed parallel beta-helix repeat-containing protein [bacterium]|nr:right-handed parallel beta-helix repeat-containing protein [bacterium]HPQ20055.1 right-handed parallel beta-helix repeat-containing protein [bacterium]